MEGIIEVRNLKVKSWNQSYALIVQINDRAELVIRKKQFDGKIEQRLNLSDSVIEVYPFSQNDTDIIIIISKDEHLQLRTTSPTVRIQWLASLNSFTSNLTKSLSIKEYPSFERSMQTKLSSIRSSVSYNKDIEIQSKIQTQQHCDSIFEK